MAPARSPPIRSATCSALPTAAAFAGCSQLVLAGDAAAALAELDEAHELGIDPTQLLRGLMESLHAATRAKAGANADALQSAEERESAEEMAQQLSLGHDPPAVADAAQGPSGRRDRARPARSGGNGAAAADPRRRHARSGRADGQAERRGARRDRRLRRAGRAIAPARPRSFRPTFRSLIAALEQSGKHQLALQLHDQVGLVRYAPPELVLKPMRPLGGDWSRDLALALKAATGATWQVSLVGRSRRALAARPGENGRGARSRRCACRSQRPRGDGRVPRCRARILFNERRLTCPKCPTSMKS